MKNGMKRLALVLLTLMLLNLHAYAEAEVLTLPAALKIIDAGAFSGDISVGKVIVPDGAEEIRSRAFADSAITEIEIPATVTAIAEDAFEGCEKVLFVCPEGSAAHEYALRHDNIVLKEAQQEVLPESEHPYADEFDHTWTYLAAEGTDSIEITFSEDTQTEEDYDFLFIYTLDGDLVGAYSGSELAGQSVAVDGAGFMLRLISDELWEDANAYYGFRVVSVVPKKAVPLTFESISAENASVPAGGTIRWTVSTVGGRGTVYYDYTILRGEEEVASGTAEAAEVIEYMPVRTGEYRLSVIARDSGSDVLEAQVSDKVTVTPTEVYPESSHPYAENTDWSWVYAAEENVESLTVTFSEETATESGYDYIYLYDQYGDLIGEYDGTALSGQTIEIIGSAFTIRLTSDHSNQYHGFTITNIEKYIPGPLSFVSLTADKAKAKSGELITWTMETEGGRRPVTYEYTVTLNGETKYTGSVTRPEQITYVPMTAGDYTMSVTAKDAEGNELPAQTSKVRITQRETTPEIDFTYEAINGLYARITGYTGTEVGVIVPEMVGEYTVQEIGDGAFRDNATLQSVVLPDTVTTVSANAFRNCDSLVGVDLGEGLTSVVDYAFYDCDALTEVDLGGKVASVGSCAFSECDSLRRFVFPDSVTTTGYSVLSGCDQLREVRFSPGWTSASNSGAIVADCPLLTRVVLPEGMTELPAYALAYNPNLEEIILPEGLVTVHEHAFANCTGLTGIVFPSAIKTVGGLSGCTGITEVIIPEGAEIIGMEAFEAVSITSIDIPGSVAEIGRYAFSECTGLESVGFSEGLRTVHTAAFSGCVNLKAAELPDSVTAIGESCFYGCTKLESFRYPLNWASVLSWYNYSTPTDGNIFTDCVSLKEIAVPEGVERIPAYAFGEAAYLVNVKLPSTLKQIGRSAFLNCTGISEIDFPDGLEMVDCGAFSGCVNLKAAELPDSVTAIGESCFYGCTKLERFRYPQNWASVLSWYNYSMPTDGNIFTDCVLLKEIAVPEGVERIPDCAFDNAAYLDDVKLPSTLKQIGRRAFRGCEGISEIAFPDGLEMVDCGAFSGCINLKAAELPDSVTAIGESCFYGCTKLERFRYPQNWASVLSWYNYSMPTDGNIFTDCVLLKEIAVPEGVERIPACAFGEAAHLERVELPSTLKEIGAKSFYGCASIEKIYISLNVTSIGNYAFGNCPNLTIYCEWGSAALQHAIDNSVPYYYLSLSGAAFPRNKIYQGDSFTLYGYVRASEPISALNARILSAADNSIVQAVELEPQATECNLNTLVNPKLLFGNLALGEYIYVVEATAGSESEVFVTSRFTVVPPPLRISASSVSAPGGYLTAGEQHTAAGTVRSNYPITTLTVGVYNAASGSAAAAVSANPGGYTADIAEVGASLNFAGLPSGSYAFRVLAVSNGETTCLHESLFVVATAEEQSEKAQAVTAAFQTSNERQNNTILMESIRLSDAAYSEKSVVSSLKALGCNESSIITRMYGSGEDKIGFAIGWKDLIDETGSAERLFVIACRGTTGSEEWASNFNLGYTGFHLGFYSAAEKVNSEMADYLASNMPEGADISDCKVWVTGHSRGAAVANILAGYFLPRLGFGSSDIYAYTFACPNVSTDDLADREYIRNYNLGGDPVPRVPLSEWGYDRYGTTIEYKNGDFESFQSDLIDTDTMNDVEETVSQILTDDRFALYARICDDLAKRDEVSAGTMIEVVWDATIWMLSPKLSTLENCWYIIKEGVVLDIAEVIMDAVPTHETNTYLNWIRSRIG